MGGRELSMSAGLALEQLGNIMGKFQYIIVIWNKTVIHQPETFGSEI